MFSSIHQLLGIHLYFYHSNCRIIINSFLICDYNYLIYFIINFCELIWFWMDYIVSQSIYLIWCKIAAIEDLWNINRQIDVKLLPLHSIHCYLFFKRKLKIIWVGKLVMILQSLNIIHLIRTTSSLLNVVKESSFEYYN